MKYCNTIDPRQNPNDLSINYAQALPGTPLYEFARSKGMIGRSLEAEEAYLLSISDRDAHDEYSALNFTDYPKLICETWRPLITIENNYHYVETFGLDHYLDHLLGGVDLPTIQRYLNFWFSSSLDLFGSEQSSNAATVFANGLKGPPDEGRYEDHVCREADYELEVPDGKGGATSERVALRNAMNEVTRRAYVEDCGIGLKRWNRLIEKAGYDFRLALPSTRFRRQIGAWANLPVAPDGTQIAREAFEAQKASWLPSEGDRAYIHSLMQQVLEPGKMAAWIAPPDRGINNLDVAYEYVQLH